jgi:hypothetical protein
MFITSGESELCRRPAFLTGCSSFGELDKPWTAESTLLRGSDMMVIGSVCD